MKSYTVIILSALALFTVIASAAPPISVTVSGTTLIAPNRTTKNAVDFAATTPYVNGQYAKTASDRIYVCIVAGTSGSAELTGVGLVVSGTATFYRVEDGPRRGILLSNTGATDISFGVGDKVTGAGDGLTLGAGQSMFISKEIQDAIWAINAGTVGVQEL